MAGTSAGEQPRVPDGRIEVADSAIAAIVHAAVLSCYGIVDMAPRSIRSAIGKRLGFASRGRGIDVHVAEGRVSIELSVVVEYGTPIFTVAKNVMKTVKFQVERTLGMPVERVNVNVEGLRVSPGTLPARGRT
ncbi:MAG: Asp23/Gls24 family envelope stress response protein [Chloroflexota bacterium]|nr:Asp23/Gls24 family envelope stress response protein [Chloroflexota bacterium]